ncbi:hypothetical protein [Rhizobium ruizarguesonis]|uniref:hypothetical protein n=1 Tax=Rhizobium ruizarguesonis TaxID=2081791 RepID=UPI00102F5AAE|nr:hypothetical protein [Rhizobium ruizarguesonis]TBD43407.1 hypothetical protein ELH19_14820 [Rhizobium ruizarguesonis]
MTSAVDSSTRPTVGLYKNVAATIVFTAASGGDELSKIGQALFVSLAVMLSTDVLWATDFTCTFPNKNEKPFIFYLSQIDLNGAKGQFTILGHKPIEVSIALRKNVLTMFGTNTSDGFQASYMATLILGKRQPIKVMYSLHGLSTVAEIDLAVPMGFERDGTCEASD